MASFSKAMLGSAFGDLASSFARSVLDVDQMEKAKRDRVAQREFARERFEYGKSRDARADQQAGFANQVSLLGAGFAPTPVEGAPSLTTPTGETFYKQPEPVKPPTGRLVGRDPQGRDVTFTGTPDQLAGVDVRPVPQAPQGPQTFTMNGRTFPDTPEGRTAALEWRQQLGGEDEQTGIQPASAEARTRILVGLPRAEQAMETIERFVTEEGDIPETSFLDRVTPGRYFQPESVQEYNAAANALATAILRVESGAAITDDEAKRYKDQFIPQPGDKPGTIQQKLARLRATLSRMRELGGLEAQQGQPTEAAPQFRLGQPQPMAQDSGPQNPFR